VNSQEIDPRWKKQRTPPDFVALLRDSAEWDAERIHTAMYSGDETAVALKEKVPVHIVYFTAWSKTGSGFDTWPDVYGHDAKQRQN
jgi:murein L,D-transpeptidase YcbB/YkuD